MSDEPQTEPLPATPRPDPSGADLASMVKLGLEPAPPEPSPEPPPPPSNNPFLAPVVEAAPESAPDDAA